MSSISRLCIYIYARHDIITNNDLVVGFQGYVYTYARHDIITNNDLVVGFQGYVYTYARHDIITNNDLVVGFEDNAHIHDVALIVITIITSLCLSLQDYISQNSNCYIIMTQVTCYRTFP